MEKRILPPSSKPKSPRKPNWGESEMQLILRLRRKNPTYGKAKIAVILNRDYGLMISERFLLELIENTPFTISSIQVDGGSEFMLHFEEACVDLGIELYVLPPKRPRYNGGVERGNHAFRGEFYVRRDMLADSAGEINAELQKAVNKYNSYRPHANLNILTSLTYIQSSYPKVA